MKLSREEWLEWLGTSPTRAASVEAAKNCDQLRKRLESAAWESPDPIVARLAGALREAEAHLLTLTKGPSHARATSGPRNEAERDPSGDGVK